jgi:hypothetical protein
VAKTTMTIATNVHTSELLWPSGLSYAAVLLMGLGCVRRSRNGIRGLSVPLFMILIAVVGAVAGCGGGSSRDVSHDPGRSLDRRGVGDFQIHRPDRQSDRHDRSELAGNPQLRHGNVNIHRRTSSTGFFTVSVNGQSANDRCGAGSIRIPHPCAGMV